MGFLKVVFEKSGLGAYRMIVSAYGFVAVVSVLMCFVLIFVLLR